MRRSTVLCRNSVHRLQKFQVHQKSHAEWKNVFQDCLKRNGLTEIDWYSVEPLKILDERGTKILQQQFKGSIINALTTLFPERKWNLWNFKQQNVPQGFWRSMDNQRHFFDTLGSQIGIRSLDDWHEQLSKKLIVEHGGGGIVEDKSPIEALISCYPEHKWIVWKFKTTPIGFWHSKDNQRMFFDWLGKQLGVKELDDWYLLKNTKTVIEHGGSFIQEFYHGSVSEALASLYPEHTWIPWKFKVTAAGFWKSEDNQRKFFDWLGQQVGVKQLDDWYSVLSLDVILQHGGAGLVDAYNNSPIKALMACYPEHKWLPWKFKSTIKGFWKSPQNQRQFFDWLGIKLGVKTLDDWYSVLNLKVVEENGGTQLLLLHGHSPIRALMASYPEHNWVPWKFDIKTSGLWNSKETISKYLSELADKLSIQTLDDWYRVDVNQFGAHTLRIKYGGLCAILKQQFPEHPWDPKKFVMAKKSQRWLKVLLQRLYPAEQILEDYLHPQAHYGVSKRPMQLDIFIPSMSLAFEYQGQHHFQDVPVFGSASHLHKKLDQEKRSLCAEHNIKLIEVPYWWDRSQESLQKLITHGELN